MNDPIPEPLSGKHVLDWAVPVTRALNAIGDKVGAPFRNERDRRGTVVDHGCWNIITGKRNGETVHFFGNQFYEDGELMLHELELEDAVEDFVGQGEPEEGEEYSSADLPYVALKIPAATNSTVSPGLVGYASLAELQAAQSNFAAAVKPLYKFNRNGSIAVDFRNCPAFQLAEALSFYQ